MNLVGTFHPDVRLGDGCSITTAIDITDAYITSLDDNLCLYITRFVGQVAATIDGSNLIRWSNVIAFFRRTSIVVFFRSRYVSFNSLPDIYLHVAQRIAVQVVTTKHTATLDNT